ncbi:hypothetical protein C3941_00105 [Kaistia algarum]|uniref:hypothetical protein n=1 Tax=Kaistia algarum TaxID=2083279 RepID=UPI000CE7651B|nr:hypothetical protein [Kaistia algarum]MCX5513380.1 hypothetical protein [Kaistia algarum]PPE81170.1 hypothetical protein C3941_00105 [Kaistia algarum]
MQTFAALLTPVIAIVAVYIAFAQWTTARRKLALDLFEHRFQFYRNAQAAIRPIIASGKPTMEDEKAYLRVLDEARFLFGTEVYEYLDDVWLAIVNLGSISNELDGLRGEERGAAIKERRREFDKISATERELPKLLDHYMRMDAPVPRTLRQWFDDANRRRKSYQEDASV